MTGLLVLSFIPVIGGSFRLAELELGTAIEFLPENPRIQSAPIPVEFHLISEIKGGVANIF